MTWWRKRERPRSHTSGNAFDPVYTLSCRVVSRQQARQRGNERTRHIFQYIPQFSHADFMIVPDLLEIVEKELARGGRGDIGVDHISTPRRILTRREARDDEALRFLFQMGDDEFGDGVVERVAAFVENEVVRESIMFFEGEGRGVVVVDLLDGEREAGDRVRVRSAVRSWRLHFSPFRSSI